MSNQEITISLAEYEALKRDADWLGYLEAAGIDNAEAYDYACELARKDGFFDNE